MNEQFTKCVYCGYDNPYENTVCFHCGAKLEHPELVKIEVDVNASAMPEPELAMEQYAPAPIRGKHLVCVTALMVLIVTYSFGGFTTLGFPSPFGSLVGGSGSPVPYSEAHLVMLKSMTIDIADVRIVREVTGYWWSYTSALPEWQLICKTPYTHPITLPSDEYLYLSFELPEGYGINTTATIAHDARIINYQAADPNGSGVNETLFKVDFHNIAWPSMGYPMIPIYGVVERWKQ